MLLQCKFIMSKFTKLKIAEYLLFLGFLLVPFTRLRFGLVGFGEVLIFISFIFCFDTNLIIRVDHKLKIFYNFFLYFLCALFIGFLYNNLINYKASGDSLTPYFDFLSYLFIFLSVIVTGHLFKNNNVTASKFFINLFTSWFVIYVILYLYSFFSSNIFGFPLFYFNFFSPLVDNIHQSASLTSALSFISFYCSVRSEKMIYKVLYFFFALTLLSMSFDSGSTKALMGIFLGFIFSLIIWVFNYFAIHFNAKTLIFFALFFVFWSGVILFVYLDDIYNFLLAFFLENDGKQAREIIYTNGFIHALSSPLVGYGPGSHAPFNGEFWDAHNTFLTVLLQSGILGFAFFMFFIFNMFIVSKTHFYLVGAFVVIFVYALGGDILRRLPIWIIFLGVTYLGFDFSRRFKF
jgi:hypothetical protein